MHEDLLKDIIPMFLKVNNKLSQVQKQVITLPNDVKISTASLHLLEAIEKYKKANSSILASNLGVTKSAVSQQIKKLEENQLIKRQFVPHNRKEVYFDLTSQGFETLEMHNLLHKSLYQEILSNLTDFSDDQGKTIEKILNIIGEEITKYQDKIEGNHD